MSGRQNWVAVSGLLLLMVVGIAAGAVGATCMGALEPLAHIGFSVGIVSVLTLLFGIAMKE